MEPVDVKTTGAGLPSGGSEGDTYYDTRTPANGGDKYYVKTSTD